MNSRALLIVVSGLLGVGLLCLVGIGGLVWIAGSGILPERQGTMTENSTPKPGGQHHPHYERTHLRRPSGYS